MFRFPFFLGFLPAARVGVEGLYTSYPVICGNNDYQVVTGLEIDKFSAEKIDASIKELKAERDAVASLL